MTQLLERNEYDTQPLEPLTEEQKAKISETVGNIAAIATIGLSGINVSKFAHTQRSDETYQV